MQSNNESNKDKSTESTGAKTEGPFVVFSQEETTIIVKEFLRAFIGGQLEIHYQDAGELMNRAKLEKQPLDFATAQKQEIEGKLFNIETMSICLNTKEASDEEKHRAINHMMDFILSGRSSRRLKGQFLTFDVEKQISDLKESLEMTNKLVNQIILSLRSGVTKF